MNSVEGPGIIFYIILKTLDLKKKKLIETCFLINDFQCRTGFMSLTGENSNSMHRYLPYCLLVHQAIFMSHEPKGPPKHSLILVCFVYEIRL